MPASTLKQFYLSALQPTAVRKSRLKKFNKYFLIQRSNGYDF